MNLSNALNSLILDYLYRAIDLRAFRETSGPLCIAACEKGTDPADLKLAKRLIGDFTDIDDGLMSEQSFRDNLTGLFFSPATSTSRYIELKIDSATRTRTSFRTEGAEPFEFAGRGLASAHA